MKYLDKFATWVVILMMFMLFCKYFCTPISNVAILKAEEYTSKIDKLNDNFEKIEKYVEIGDDIDEGFKFTDSGTDIEDVFNGIK